MKRVLAIVFFLVSLLYASSASAVLLGYRYVIPKTDDAYSIEFPSFFVVESTIMDSFYPAVYIFGLDKDETIDNLIQEKNEIVAYDKSSLDAMIFIRILPKYWGFSFQDLPYRDMKAFADEYVDEFYKHYPHAIPIDNDSLSFVYRTDRLYFIYFAYEWNNNGSRAFSTHYDLIEHEYSIDIRCVYFNDDVDFISRTEHKMEYIIDSVIKHK